MDSSESESGAGRGREISLFEQVESDIMIVDQAVADAVGERLAEIISVADVRRIGAQSHHKMRRAAHGMIWRVLVIAGALKNGRQCARPGSTSASG